jgi:hypothetical protein
MPSGRKSADSDPCSSTGHGISVTLVPEVGPVTVITFTSTVTLPSAADMARGRGAALRPVGAARRGAKQGVRVRRYAGERGEGRYAGERGEGRYAGERGEGRYAGERGEGRYAGERAKGRYAGERGRGRYAGGRRERRGGWSGRGEGKALGVRVRRGRGGLLRTRRLLRLLA